MWKFHSKRQTAGNICLVLFTAFLFTILVAPVTMVGSAEAAQQTENDTTITTVAPSGSTFVQSGTSSTVTGTSSGYQLLVRLAVDPLTDFNSLKVQFVNANGTILTVYATDSAKTTYLGNSVYGAVYSLAYLAPSNFYVSANNIVYGYVYIGDTLYDSIIFTLTLQPPESSSGGDGGGTTTTTTTTTNTGTITFDSSTGTATTTVDTSKITSLINSNQPVVIQAVPTGTTATTVKVEMAASILSTLADKSKDLTVKTDDVQFVIPPAALDVPVLADLVKSDPNTKVTLNVKEVTSASVGLADKISVPENANLKAVGKVFDFEIIAKSSAGETKIGTFTKKIRVAIPYTDADVSELNEDYLAAYRITVNGLVFLGGDVDKVNNLVCFDTDSFSSYTLLAKIAAFADIMNHWAKNDIQLMADKGVVKGVTNNKFAPDSSVTRAQFATLLVKALGLTEVKPAKARFKDVNSGAWYYSMVETAAANGLVAGYSDGTFAPEGRITRQEMAAMIANALKAGGKSVILTSGEAGQLLSKFSDRQQIAGWAQNSVAVAVKEGIITGRTTTTFVAKADATRAEGTVMIKKVLGSLGKL